MTNEKDAGSGAACYTFVDKPHAIVAAIDQPITCAKACEVGQAIASCGCTARMVGGTVAELAVLGARMRDEGQRYDG